MSKHAAPSAAKKPGAAAKPAAPAGKGEHAALNHQVKGANYAEGKEIVKPKAKHGGKHDGLHAGKHGGGHPAEEELGPEHAEALHGEHDDGKVHSGGHLGIVEKAAAVAKAGSAQYVSSKRPGGAMKATPSDGGSQSTVFAKGSKPDALKKHKSKH